MLSPAAVRRPAAVANVEGSARFGGCAATQGEKGKKENMWEEIRDWPGHSEADQLRVRQAARTADGKGGGSKSRRRPGTLILEKTVGSRVW